MDPRATLDELFGAPLDRFVETRDRLAAELARAGTKDEGRALKKLKRPSPSAWATNQVVRRARGAVDEYFGASDRLRRSQAAVVAGRGGETGYQAGVEGLRQATAALTRAARAVLAEAGRGDERHLIDGVLANVRAAALAEARREELLGGQLATDVDAGGELFGGLLGGAPLPDDPAAEAPPAPHEVPGREQQAKQAREEQAKQAREEERRQRLAAARRDEATAVAAAARAEAAVVEARAASDAAAVAAGAAAIALTDAQERAAAATQRREALEGEGARRSS